MDNKKNMAEEYDFEDLKAVKTKLDSHDYHITTLHDDNRTLRTQMDAGFDKLFAKIDSLTTRFVSENKFPTSTVITLIFGVFAIGTTLMAGYVGLPMSEMKDDIIYVQKNREEEAERRGKMYEKIEQNEERSKQIVAWYIEDVKKITAIDEMQQALEKRLVLAEASLSSRDGMRFNKPDGDTLKAELLRENDKLWQELRDIKSNRFTNDEGNRLKQDIKEISAEQRRRTEKVYE